MPFTDPAIKVASTATPVRLTAVYSGPGVYVYSLDGTVLFVGCTGTSLAARACDPHHKHAAIRDAGAEVLLIPTADAAAARELKRRLIQRHRPMYNIRGITSEVRRNHVGCARCKVTAVLGAGTSPPLCGRCHCRMVPLTEPVASKRMQLIFCTVCGHNLRMPKQDAAKGIPLCGNERCPQFRHEMNTSVEA